MRDVFQRFVMCVDFFFSFDAFDVSQRCVEAREDEGRERIPHTWASSDENNFKSIFGSLWLF